MPHKDLRWRDLLPGIVVMAIVGVLGFYILTRVGIGNLPGRKFTLYAVAEQARGILRGSDIWIGGIRAGTVTGVSFLDPAPGAFSRVVMRIEVLEQHRHLLRRDSEAQIRRGARIIGNPVIQLSFGTAQAAPLEDGDTVIVIPQYDSDIVAARVEQSMRTLPFIAEDIRLLMADARTAQGRFTATFGGGAGLASPLTALMENMRQLSASFERGSATLIMRDTSLARQWSDIRVLADSVVRMYDPAQSVAANYIRDLQLAEVLNRVLTNFTALSVELSRRGTDFTSGERANALRAELARVTASLRALREDARRHPLRYIVF